MVTHCTTFVTDPSPNGRLELKMTGIVILGTMGPGVSFPIILHIRISKVPNFYCKELIKRILLNPNSFSTFV